MNLCWDHSIAPDQTDFCSFPEPLSSNILVLWLYKTDAVKTKMLLSPDGEQMITQWFSFSSRNYIAQAIVSVSASSWLLNRFPNVSFEESEMLWQWSSRDKIILVVRRVFETAAFFLWRVSKISSIILVLFSPFDRNLENSRRIFDNADF